VSSRHCEERSDEAIHSFFAGLDGLLRFARNDVEASVTQRCLPHSRTGTLRNFFIIFVDRIFTTFIERPFTNAFDARSEIAANPCV
jgi:hypothetical protein